MCYKRSFYSELLQRPGEDTHVGVLSVCLGAFGRPYRLSPQLDCGLVAPCPQASHPAGPDPRRSGFPSCVTRFFGSWRRAAAVFVLLSVKILLDIHPQTSSHFWPTEYTSSRRADRMGSCRRTDSTRLRSKVVTASSSPAPHWCRTLPQGSQITEWPQAT